MSEGNFYQNFGFGIVIGYLAIYLIRNKSIFKGANKYKNFKLVMVVKSNMDKNKTAVHCSRAALDCYQKAVITCPDSVMKWERNSQPKIVLKLDGGNDNVLQLQSKADSLGITSAVVQEEGIFTVIGVGPASSESIDLVTGHLKLLG